MKGKKIAGICMGAVLACGSLFGLSACQKDDRDPQILEVYNMYVASAQSEGETPMSYEEWLDSIKGPKGDTGAKGDKGDKGDSGVGIKDVTVNENGELVIEYTDGTTKNCGKVVGENGADGEKGEPGTNGTNGTDGKDGVDGQRGTKIFTGEEDEPIAITNRLIVNGDIKSRQDLIDGDLYICTISGNFYKYSKNGGFALIGNIKGPKGEQGERGEKGEKGDSGVVEEPVDPREEQDLQITAGASQSISVQGLTGEQVVIMDLGKTKLSTGRINIQFEGENTISEICYSEARSDSEHNIYFGYIFVPEGKTEVNVKAIGEDVKATIKFEEYNAPTLALDGDTIDVCLNANITSEGNFVKFKINKEKFQSGDYYVTMTNYSSLYKSTVQIFIGSDTTGVRFSGNGTAKKIKIDTKYFNSEGDTYVYIKVAGQGDAYTYPVSIKIATNQ